LALRLSGEADEFGPIQVENRSSHTKLRSRVADDRQNLLRKRKEAGILKK